jgi:hypothetical protein
LVETAQSHKSYFVVAVTSYGERYLPIASKGEGIV